MTPTFSEREAVDRGSSCRKSHTRIMRSLFIEASKRCQYLVDCRVSDIRAGSSMFLLEVRYSCREFRMFRISLRGFHIPVGSSTKAGRCCVKRLFVRIQCPERGPIPRFPSPHQFLSGLVFGSCCVSGSCPAAAVGCRVHLAYFKMLCFLHR